MADRLHVTTAYVAHSASPAHPACRRTHTAARPAADPASAARGSTAARPNTSTHGTPSPDRSALAPGRDEVGRLGNRITGHGVEYPGRRVRIEERPGFGPLYPGATAAACSDQGGSDEGEENTRFANGLPQRTRLSWPVHHCVDFLFE